MGFGVQTRLSHSDDVVLICYHIHNISPPTTTPAHTTGYISIQLITPCLSIGRWSFGSAAAVALSDFSVFLIFLADRSRLALPLTSHLPSIKPESF